jgi:hypothetical protein
MNADLQVCDDETSVILGLYVCIVACSSLVRVCDCSTRRLHFRVHLTQRANRA